MSAINRFTNKIHRLEFGESTSTVLDVENLIFVLKLMHVDFDKIKFEIDTIDYVNPYTGLNQFYIIAKRVR